MKYENLSVQALKCMYVSTALSSLLALAVLGAVNYFYLIPEDIVPGKLASLILAVLICLNLLFSPWFRYHRYGTASTRSASTSGKAICLPGRDIVPIERLHKLQTAKGPLDQIFGVAKVIVTTAGGDVTIRFLEEKQAEEIADSLRRRINQIVTEQRNDYGNTN